MTKAEPTKTFFDRAAILGVSDIQTEEVHVPEWQTWVRVRGLTAAERDDFEQSCVVGKGKNKDVSVRDLRAKLVVRSLVDGDGARLFGDGDYLMLGQKSAAAVDRIYDVAARLSGISETDEEELLGNSTPGQSAGPTSA